MKSLVNNKKLSTISEVKKMKTKRMNMPVLVTMFSSLALFGAINPTFAASHEVTHTFSLNDVLGGFDGSTVATDPTIVCGTAENACPANANQPKDEQISKGKDGSETVSLYPVDNQYGFYVEDFVGAADKVRDGDYAEGYAGNVAGGGLAISNVPTLKFKTPPLMGNWCAGLGGNAVKCATEHYVTMESVKTCHETVATGGDNNLIDPDPENGAVIASCDTEKLDDVLRIVVNDSVDENSEILTSVEPGDQMEANESTVRNDIAISKDYSVTLKDDGKPLYRWGNIVKRPNDVRVYARMELPAEWKEAGKEFRVTKAHLTLDHLITNNPNDQVRPEDMENEGAIGVLPSFAPVNDTWVSQYDCYAGDGKLIPSGSLLRDEGQADAMAFSGDLIKGFSHFWYSTTDRDPFEWSYTGGSSPLPSTELGSLNSGPRWRLKPNKFGQDIPGLEIPATKCAQPPFENGTLKYETGESTTTVLNLLDWEEGADGLDESPLVSSLAWIDMNNNPVNEASGEHAGVSINGLPMTDDFDLAVYVKGDQKPTIVYSAKLELEYDEVVDMPPVTQ